MVDIPLEMNMVTGSVIQKWVILLSSHPIMEKEKSGLFLITVPIVDYTSFNSIGNNMEFTILHVENVQNGAIKTFGQLVAGRINLQNSRFMSTKED